MSAVLWQKIEGGLVFLACLIAVIGSAMVERSLPWWAMVILFFAPDLGFLGYLRGPRIGALTYNAVHLYGWGLLLAVGGSVLFGSGPVTDLGLIWMAHVGFDRMLGYGLKEPTAFGDTHLGRIGRK